MSELDTKTEVAELKEQCALLAQQVKTLLYALVVASFTLTAFLGLQARRAGRELNQIKPQAAQMAEISKREEVGMRTFLGQLVDYSKSHPDYAVLLKKYNIITVKPPAAPGADPTAAPAPK